MLVDSCVPSPCPLLPHVWDGSQWSSRPLPPTAADVVGLSGGVGDMSPEQLATARAAQHGPVTYGFLKAMQDLAARRKGPVSYRELLQEAEKHLRGRRSGCQAIFHELFGPFFLCFCRVFGGFRMVRIDFSFVFDRFGLRFARRHGS